MAKKLIAVFALACSFQNGVALAQAFTLEQAMAAPDWIGLPPEQGYWSDDGKSVYFSQKRSGVEQKDLYQVELTGGPATKIEIEHESNAAVDGGNIANSGRFKVYSRAGDIYVKDLRSDGIVQLTRTIEQETNPYFSADSKRVIFQREDRFFVRDLTNGLEYLAAEILSEDRPTEEKSSSYLEQRQSALFENVRKQEERKEQQQDDEKIKRQLDPSRVGLPFYIGKDEEIQQQKLSPSEEWMSLVVRDSNDHKLGRAGLMPNYVTQSGYTESTTVRARVGTTQFATERLILLDLTNHKLTELDLTPLLENLVKPQSEAEVSSDNDKKTPSQNLRFFGLEWTNDGTQLLFNVVSGDNKHRWLIVIDLAAIALSDAEDFEFSENLLLDNPSVKVIHHHHDPAWINRQFIAAHWLNNNRSLFFLSEADGYGHAYLYKDGDVTQLTNGKFEVREPTLDRENKMLYFRGNVIDPTVWEIHRVDLATTKIEQLTQLGGLNTFSLSPDDRNLLITHSEATSPPELYVQRARGNSPATKLTNTVSQTFKAINWALPETVAIRSSFSDNPIYSRVYTPDDDSLNRPAVVFIHGAGYLQNAHQGWSSYFREFMFHTYLVQQGYVVLDMDYRASLGYGRDWRTAIYRQMGTPEVQDLANGIDYLVANKRVDRARICAYGGSYGGFLTLMAMFKKPDLFACGAALRPVTDWTTYNHGYTSNILNIPELDPAAYETSSPIDYAEGLEKPLLIAHGMQDDNVFFQDSVRLVQRLIELGKTNFELAIYPIEAHGFREPSSWLDEYRRIYKLIEQTLN